jgi:arginyl-tRNA synthetase
MTLAKLKIHLDGVVTSVLGSDLDLSKYSVTYTTDPKFGDISVNAAMVYSKDLGLNPREAAAKLAVAIESELDVAERVEVAGPGFINVTLMSQAIVTAVQAAVDFEAVNYAGQKVIIEYSDPNPFKPLHAGHLYTTLVGDVIARLLEHGGAEVVRISYGGDVGRHVAMTMWAIIRNLGGESPEKLDDVLESQRAEWLGSRYVEGNTAYEDDDSARQEIIAINKRVYRLHTDNDHHSPFAKIYWMGRQWSYDYFPELYKQLGVVPFDRTIPESEVTQLGIVTVQKQLQAGVYEKSDGAVVFKGEPYGLHTRVFINSQGLPTYEAKDVGLLLTKWHDYRFDRSIVITANEQEQYMAVMLKSVEQFAPEPARRSEHLTHGMVKLAGGIKMSSRRGNIVGAMDILDVATEAARKISKTATHGTVIAAVKYAFLKQRIGGDIVYEPEESVSLDGNSGPYLQYAHARARSILAKAGVVKTGLEYLEEGERTLARKLIEYPDVIVRAVTDLTPHVICTYLYEVAQVFNRFYENNRVMGDPREQPRLALVSQYADVLKDGLSILGIEAPDRL